MKAMVLCAGKGTRLRPMTFDTPKPMIPLIDKPVLEHIFDHLVGQGIDEVAVNLSYRPEDIHNYFRSGDNHGLRIFYSYEGEMLNGVFGGSAIGSAGGMKKIQNESGFFDDTFLVLCGDAAINLDIQSVVKQHKERGAIATVVLKTVEENEVEKYGVVALSNEGRIEQFQEKPTPAKAISTTANTGIYIFEPEIFNYIPDNVEYDLGGDLFPKLAEESERLFGAVAEFDWIDIGNVHDYRQATHFLLSNPPQGIAIPGIEVQPGIHLGPNVNIDLDNAKIEGPVYIGGGSVIEPHVRIIGPTVIGQNAHIGEHAIIHQSILGDHTKIFRNTLLTRAIVYGGFLINERGDSEPLPSGGAIGDARACTEYRPVQDWAVANLELVDRMIISEMTVDHKQTA